MVITNTRDEREISLAPVQKKEAAIIHPGEAQDWQLFALPTVK